MINKDATAAYLFKLNTTYLTCNLENVSYRDGDAQGEKISDISSYFETASDGRLLKAINPLGRNARRSLTKA
jgi:hypothetical protein